MLILLLLPYSLSLLDETSENETVQIMKQNVHSQVYTCTIMKLPSECRQGDAKQGIRLYLVLLVELDYNNMVAYTFLFYSEGSVSNLHPLYMKHSHSSE